MMASPLTLTLEDIVRALVELEQHGMGRESETYRVLMALWLEQTGREWI